MDDLPKWEPKPVNLKDNDEVGVLDYFIIDNPPYFYNKTTYGVAFNRNYVGERKDGILYEVTEDGEKEIATFTVTKQTLDETSEIGDGQLNGSYFVGEVNQPLYEGKQYRVVWAENYFVVNNPFLRQYVYNPEVAVTLKGTTPEGVDTGLGEVEESAYALTKDGANVIISGLKGGDVVTVYTAGGMKVAELGEVSAGMKNASVNLPEGQLYIVLINGTAIKYRH